MHQYPLLLHFSETAWTVIRERRMLRDILIKKNYRPGGGETICPRRWQFDSRRIYVRPRTYPQSAHLWWPAVAKLQAASVTIAYGSCAMGQTDGRKDRGIA